MIARRLTTFKITSLWIYLILPIAVHSASHQARIQNTDYWDLRYVANCVDLETSWIISNEQLKLFSSQIDLRFQLHKKEYTHNDLKVYLGYPVAKHRGSLYISKNDFRKVLIPLLVPKAIKNPKKLYRIVIDPGHGGKDPGTQNHRYNLSEKDLVLKVAQKLKLLLQKRGYKVLMTRNSDVFLRLEERAEFSNRNRADLFLSLHFNAASTKSVHGLETFLYTPPYQPSTYRTKYLASDKIIRKGNINDDWNIIVGSLVQRRILRTMRLKDRGIKKARFQVLRDITSPGMLLELGFLSNDATARSLRSDDYLFNLALSITNGVLDYQKLLNQLRSR